jgi:hypothetical protein
MKSSRRRKPDTAELLAPLHARIAELEVRIKLLEAKVVRHAERPVAPAQSAVADRTPDSGRKPPRPARARPRCPGCLLELPKGRRGKECVWCGFVFAAVEGWVFR